MEKRLMSRPPSIRDLDPDRVWDYENGWYWYSDPTRIGKLLAQFEIYKSILELDGDIVEFGVYKAASLIRLASFRHALEKDSRRRIIGFDAFGIFPRSGDEKDEAFVQRFEADSGDGLSAEEIKALLAAKGLDKGLELVAGDLCQTLPPWLEQNPDCRFALIHVDVDIYEPTRVILEHCWDRLVSGGVLVLDDYRTVEGETRAVDEFLEKKPGLEPIKTTLAHIPWYIEKP